MPGLLALAGLLLVLLIPSARPESAELRFQGQTEFVVNESSRAIVRLVVERVGDPINVTALVLFRNTLSEATVAVFLLVREPGTVSRIHVCVFQSSSNGVTVGTPNTATITILSNDNAFGIISFNSTTLITVEEPKGRNQYVPLTLIREKGTYGTVTVNFEISGGPNPASEDLSPDRGNLTIPPGRAVVVFSVLIQDDKIPEDDEIFTVQLTGVAGGALLNPNRTAVQIKISRNDAPVRFSQPSLAVPESVGIINLTVTRGRTEDGLLIGSDDREVSVAYAIVTGNGAASATLSEDFVDLQATRTVLFPRGVHEKVLQFNIVDDRVPEIAESFQVLLLEDTLLGDAVLVYPSFVQVTIEPNDKPYGVLSISSPPPTQPITINEDTTVRFEGITIVRNGGTHGLVSVNWTITRNSTDRTPVTADLFPAFGTLSFTEGQMTAILPLNITQDSLPEEAEAFLLRLIPSSVLGGAEVDEPMGMVFYIQDSDDVYGRFGFHPNETQSIQSRPDVRFLSLSFLREGVTLGEVRLAFTVLYIPAGPLDPARARDGVLNGTSANSVLFSSGQSKVQIILPIRNDAFLQNGAHFLIQLDSLQVINITPLIPSVSPCFGGAVNISLRITPDIANGEIGFTSNQTVVAVEPEESNTSVIILPLRRDGTDGQAVVFWSVRPVGENRADVTKDDLSQFSGSVVFLTGQSEANISITIMADNVPEINETVLLTLDRTNVENQILKPGFTSREIVILENDDPGGVFEFSPVSKGPWFINEGETVELRVIRQQGQLLNQLVRYTVTPSGNEDFYGATGILEFQPGEREVVVALVAIPDGLPELDEMFAVVLSSHSTPASRLGTRRQVNITVQKSDDPFGVIEFTQPGFRFSINESKAMDLHSASYPIMRGRGRFGNVSVLWRIEPTYSGDVTPFQGEVVFAEGEYLKNLTLYSKPDEIPEDNEEFTIILINATGGARLGSVLNASLQIRKNDDPIYFAEPAIRRVREGGVANFTILRAGLANFVATVQYRFEYGDSSPGDFSQLSNDSLLVFDYGEWMKNISVAVMDDDVPETDEAFYIVLFNTTGDAVVYGQDTATVVIEANDDPNGIFSLDDTQKPVEEGKTNNFHVIRNRGHFGNVTVFWQLFANDTPLEPHQEFVNTSGFIVFTTGEKTKPIVLEAISDKMPEFNEFYELRLMNISGGYPGEGGKLADKNLNASVLIPFNDDPFGVFAIDKDNLDQEIAEDVLSVDDMSSVTSFTILRQQGTFGDVRLAWEILSGDFPQGLPPMVDLILMATFPPAVMLQPHARRHHSGTDALFFSGLAGAYGSIGPEVQPQEIPHSLANFTFSAWLMPRPNTDGFIASKGNGTGTMYYGVKIQINESHVSVMLHYTTLGSNSTQVARATAAKFVEDNVWVHVIIAVEDGIIEFYLDGSPMPGGIKSLKGEAVLNDVAPILIGSDPDGHQLFTGVLQDVRLYLSRLNQSEIRELHGQPAKTDLRNVSGYLAYRQEEKQKSFVVETRDDLEEEGEEVFYLQLVAVYGGARIPLPRPTARIRVSKSDNANGLFGFTGACIPDVRPCHCNTTADISTKHNTLTSSVLNLLVLDDDIPEFDEFFQVRLVSAQSGDGKQGSTPTSGASIDPANAINNITIKASDHPYGLLQFQTAPITQAMIRPAVEEARITVSEEAGILRLPVARAQGLLGRVLVAYRTIPLTAISPKDYQYISKIRISLKHFFQVLLENEIYISIKGSGSGESDPDFLLPPFHYHHANLGIASRITVTIAASDEAHGVFQFSADSLAVNGTEPEEGRSTVVLQVIRAFGTLSNVTVYWEADADSEGELIYRSGNLTFNMGQTVGSIYLLISQDDVPELDKSFRVRLSNISHGRLGNQTAAAVTVLASDDPYGQFVFADSSRPVRVAEADALVTLTIQRRKGLMGRVRVAYRTLRDTDPEPFSTPGVGRASAGNDFVPVSASVTFSANQSEANITMKVLDDTDPERAESVFVELSSVTLVEGVQARPVAASPRLGLRNVSVAQVIIEASDDAFGVLQLSATAVSVPEYYTGPIINVTRTGGIFADVSVKFRAVPMTARIIKLELTGATNGGSIGADKAVSIIVPANDNPYGTVFFEQAVYRIQEPLEGVRIANITVRRSGGNFGLLEILYSTFEFDVVSNAQIGGQNFLIYFNSPMAGAPSSAIQRPINITSVRDPRNFCAASCLRERACQAFTFTNTSSPSCFWVTAGANQLSAAAQTFTYIKNTTAAAFLFSSQAVPGSDYVTMTGQTAAMPDGSSVANLTVPILTDSLPEVDESFMVQILKVSLVNITVAAKHLPTIGQPDTARVTIGMNGDAFGVFIIYSISPNATEKGLYLEVREEPGTRVPLVIERTGGSLGQVTVEWMFIGGSAKPSEDFNGTGETLIFAEGDVKKTLDFFITDDTEPEDNETLRIGLVRTEGGSRILPSSDTVTILILANDYAAGLVGFSPASRSVIVREGERLSLLVERTLPAIGNVTVEWRIQGPQPTLTFVDTSGVLFFSEVNQSEKKKSSTLKVSLSAVAKTIKGYDGTGTHPLYDDIPELQEFFLVNITSAVLISTLPTTPKLDTQGMIAEVRINANDGVRGIISWQTVDYEVNETIGVLTLVAYRHAGTYGNVSVFFYAQNLEAQLGLDFNATASTLTFMNGERHKFVEVLILDDPIPEGDEKFQLILTNPSPGLELGENTTATVTILANDDGHGIISYNKSEHFLLREPSSMIGLDQSVATLYIVRNPPQGTFGTVSVQFSITDVNGTLNTEDLTPSEGFVVLEDGVRYKTLEIWAVLDAEPEMNETFTVTLFNPTGGARLGEPTQTFITVLQNQAPLGLFRISPSSNRTLSSLTVEETVGSVYLTVSRSNGLDSAVSVEFETQSDTAFGLKGDFPYLAEYQRFRDTLPVHWCSESSGDSALLFRIGSINNMQDQLTLYMWQGVFVPVETVSVQRASSCVGFTVNGTAYVAVSHGDTTESPTANLSLFRLQPDLNLTLEQTVTVGSRDVRPFKVNSQQYFIASNQVFIWTGSSLSLHHTLELQNITALSPFIRASGTGQYLTVCRNSASSTCLIYQWISGSFQNPQPLPVNNRVKQVESIHTGGDTLLLIVTEGPNPVCEVFLWGSQQAFFQKTQSIPFPSLSSVHAFTPTSGIPHLLLAGTNESALYSWKSELSQFTKVLSSSPAQQFLYLPVPSLNTTKSLIIARGSSDSIAYELISVSNQSDFIPRYSTADAMIEINIIDDTIVEPMESFLVKLTRVIGGARLGTDTSVVINIPANDSPLGRFGFEELTNSLFREVDELERDTPVTLSVERRRGTFGKLTVRWAANGSLEDIFPTSGVVTFSEGQAVATISLNVLADSVPETAEKVTIVLTDVTTVGVIDLSRRAVIDPQRARAELTIKANGSPYGVIGWHLDSQYFITAEPPRSPSNITLSIVREQGASGNVVVYYTTRPALSLPPVNQASEGEDYLAKQATVVMMEQAAVALVTITILPDDFPELAETFLVNITHVELMGGQTGAGQPSLRRPGMEIAEITIQENDDPRGVLQFNVSRDASGVVFGHEVPPPDNILYLPVVRLAGRSDRIVVFWEAQPVIATIEDFTPTSGNLTFQDGQVNNTCWLMLTLCLMLTGLIYIYSALHNYWHPWLRSISPTPSTKSNHLESRSNTHTPLTSFQTESRQTLMIQALADAVLEGEERFTVQLLSAENEAVINPTRNMATVVIRADRGALGIVGVADTSRNVIIGEPQGAYNGTALISLVRGPGIFGEIEIYWNITPAVPAEFVEISGKVIMRDRQSAATIQLKALDDEIPEERRVYELRLVSLTPGSEISPNRQSAIITMAASDMPYGLFSFSQSSLSASEEDRSVNVTVVRSMGLLGSVWVSYQTEGRTAVIGLDFNQSSGRLLFSPGDSFKIITLKILDDSLPEGPEEFYLNITQVQLLNESALNFTIREQGLQLDQPPAIGNISSAMILIQKNDNVEGVLEFDPDFTNITVEEEVGTVSIPVLRRVGTYGQVTAEYFSRGVTAEPGADYILPNGTITFRPGQILNHINVTIVDDLDREYNEMFEIQLTAATGGAILGAQLISQITIAKSDSPSGVVRFVNQSLITIPNPNSTLRLSLVLERVGGLVGDITWYILGPNSNAVLPPVNTDIAEPVNGSFEFRDGEEGVRVIELRILPHGEVEVEETFVVKLRVVSGEMGVDARAGSVTLRVSYQYFTYTSLSRSYLCFLSRSLARAVFLSVSRSRSLSLSLVLSLSLARGLSLVLSRSRTVCLSFSHSRSRILCVGRNCLLFLQVGFASLALHVSEVVSGQCEAVVSRTGLYGDVDVQWRAGFPAGQSPSGYQPGAVTPSSGTVTLSHGQRSQIIPLSAAYNISEPVVHAVHLTSVDSRAPGGLSHGELPKAEPVGPSLIWPAVAGMDFTMAEGTLTFDVGQQSAGLDVALTPKTGSSNPTPKRFRVILSDATGGARVHPEYGISNVTLVSDAETQAVWALLDQLQQPLDEAVINRVLQGLINKVSVENTQEQQTAVLDAVSKILIVAEQTPLEQSSHGLTYDLLCALAKPSRADTRGLSHLSEVAERFAFSLVTDLPCGGEGQRGKTILDSCPYMTISAYNWYPTQINSHTFTGKNGDTFTLPETLLEVPALPGGEMAPSACQKVHFIEYSTEHWFLTNKASALNDKVFSVSIQGRGSRPLADGKEVVYRIHTPDRRVKPRQSLCLLWNQAAESWLSDGQFCRVVDDTENFVECACTHLSIYTAYAEIGALSTYNEAFYAAGFICISGFALAIISHVLCSRFPMFAAKLLTHMMVACLGMQICFLVSAFRGKMFNKDGCAALGLFFHYFHLSQFSWMLIQAINFWQTLVMNDEHTERRYLLYFLLSWGLPALVIIVLVIVLLGGYGWNIHEVYGLVQGDLCFIPNIYAALCTAAFVPLICLVGVLVVFIHAYHVTQQWKAYDDVYRGRTNSSEVPMVLYLFALVTLVCLWAGLHMAYRYLWMLILLVIFNGINKECVSCFCWCNCLFCPAKVFYLILENCSGLNLSDNESIPGSHDGGSVSNSQIVELRRIPIADTHL
uniref:Adhesion G protein-coupled receptor V1 n=1 Tax=Astyanax mexicanus TaxID=7994 RepID=A0A8B9KDR7_ASTMX